MQRTSYLDTRITKELASLFKVQIYISSSIFPDHPEMAYVCGLSFGPPHHCSKVLVFLDGKDCSSSLIWKQLGYSKVFFQHLLLFGIGKPQLDTLKTWVSSIRMGPPGQHQPWLVTIVKFPQGPVLETWLNWCILPVTLLTLSLPLPGWVSAFPGLHWL